MRCKCTVYTPIDCQEIKFPASEMTSLNNHRKITVQSRMFQVDHKSLLGCHRDDEDKCVMEER